jgi:hypothetical protein
MQVLNIHERELAASPQQIGALIDTLSSLDDALWPRQSWPRMAFDRPLGVGAIGGHGPVRYVVEAYEPGRRIRFAFTGPRGLRGHHRLEIINPTVHSCVLRHTIEMTTHGAARLTWPLVFRPLHDALLEDALAVAQAALGHTPVMRPWSLWVKALRWMLSRGRTSRQVTPRPAVQRAGRAAGSLGP